MAFLSEEGGVTLKVSTNKMATYLSLLMMTLLVNSFIYTNFIYMYFFVSIILLLVQFAEKGNISKIDLILLFFVLSLPIVPIVAKFEYDYTALYIFFVFSALGGYSLSILNPIKNSFLCSIPWLISLLSFSVLYSKGYIAEDFFPNNSRNFVSVTLLSAVCSYYVLLKKWDSSFYVIILATLSLFYCLYAVGRSGIITFLFVYLVIIFHYFMKIMKNIRSKKLRYSLIFSFSLILLTGVILISKELYELGLFDRIISRGFHDYSRESILKEYFQEIGASSLLIGVSYADLSLMEKFRNNLHNSYLSMHSAFGFLYVLFFALLSIVMVKVSLIKRQPIYLALVFSLLARAWSDIQIFSGRLDWFFMFSFFYITRERLYIKDNKKSFYAKRYKKDQ